MFHSLKVVHVDFEESLRMGADGAEFGGLGAHDNMSAVAALPYLHFALLEDSGRFHVLQEGTVTLFMALFNSGYFYTNQEAMELFGVCSPTIGLNKGVDIKTISTLMGHSSVLITEKVYASVLPSTLEQAVKEKLNFKF